MNIKFSKYETVSKEFSKFFSEDELSIRFDGKADKNAILKMNNIKANKNELAITN